MACFVILIRQKAQNQFTVQSTFDDDVVLDKYKNLHCGCTPIIPRAIPGVA